MSTGFELSAELRTTTGKAKARRMRHAGLVPGVIYGAGKDPAMITLPHDAILHALNSEAFHSHVLKVQLDNGQAESVVLKAVQRHAYKPKIVHVDFLRVRASEKLTMRVPLHYLGEEECVGVVEGGGVISKLMTDVEIKCLPKDLPEFIEVSIAKLELDQALHMSDVKLPAGVVLSHELDEAHDHPIVSVHPPKVSKEDVDAEVAAEEEAKDEAPAEEAVGDEAEEGKGDNKAEGAEDKPADEADNAE